MQLENLCLLPFFERCCMFDDKTGNHRQLGQYSEGNVTWTYGLKCTVCRPRAYKDFSPLPVFLCIKSSKKVDNQYQSSLCFWVNLTGLLTMNCSGAGKLRCGNTTSNWSMFTFWFWRLERSKYKNSPIMSYSFHAPGQKSVRFTLAVHLTILCKNCPKSLLGSYLYF